MRSVPVMNLIISTMFLLLCGIFALPLDNHQNNNNDSPVPSPMKSSSSSSLLSLSSSSFSSQSPSTIQDLFFQQRHLSTVNTTSSGLRRRRENRKPSVDRKKSRHRRRQRMEEMRTHLKRLFIEQNSEPKEDEEVKLDDEKSFKRLHSASSFPSANSKPIFIGKATQIRKKKDWCRTETLKQRIQEQGCLPKIILNNYCYGQCNSFYIPTYFDEVDTKDNHSGSYDVSFNLTSEAPKEAAAFKSCSFCKPKKFRYISVRLHCPLLTPPYKRKTVQLIEKCRCIAEVLRT